MSHRAPASRPPEPTLSQLPPLAALRAFTATARHLNFVRAAEELHVTPAAVGQHVRHLETHFGRPLFLRDRGRLELTDAGRALFPGLQQAFEAVLASVCKVRGSDGGAELRVAAVPSFISKWLIPRLASFREAVPDARIVLQNHDGADLQDGGCAIRALRDGARGQEADYLFQEELVPVCTPSYRMRHGLHGGDPGLERITLLDEVRQEEDSLYPGWEKWLRANGFQEPVPARRLTFADPSMVIDAALAGQGLGLASLRLARHDLATGRLVVPFGAATPVRDAYFFLASGPVASSSVLGLFRRWLLQEAAAERASAAPQAALREEPFGIAAE